MADNSALTFVFLANSIAVILLQPFALWTVGRGRRMALPVAGAAMALGVLPFSLATSSVALWVGGAVAIAVAEVLVVLWLDDQVRHLPSPATAYGYLSPGRRSRRPGLCYRFVLARRENDGHGRRLRQLALGARCWFPGRRRTRHRPASPPGRARHRGRERTSNRKEQGMKTSSLWGQPQSRYYSYLARIEAAEATKAPALAVIGCADGTEVLPAARKGFDVWAVDVDDIAVNGGVKEDASGEVQVPGLVSRVKQENLSDRARGHLR